MRTRTLTPTAFKVRITFLLAIGVMAVTMKIISLFNPKQSGLPSRQKMEIVDKEMISKMPEKTILLDGLAVTIADALILNKAEYALLRETFQKKPVESWTVLVDEHPAFTAKTGI